MFEKQEKELIQLRRELKKRVKDIKKTLTQSRRKDWKEAAVEAENDEVLKAIYSETAQELL